MQKYFAFCFVEFKNAEWADLLIESIRKYFDNPIYLTTASNYSSNRKDVFVFNGMAKWPEFGFPESNHTKGLNFLANIVKDAGYKYLVTLDNDSIIYNDNFIELIKQMDNDMNILVTGQEDYGPVSMIHRNYKNKIHPSFSIIRLDWFKSFFPKDVKDYIKDYSETYYGLTEGLELKHIKFVEFDLISPQLEFGLASKTYLDPKKPFLLHSWYGSSINELGDEEIILKDIKAKTIKEGVKNFFNLCKKIVYENYRYNF